MALGERFFLHYVLIALAIVGAIGGAGFTLYRADKAQAEIEAGRVPEVVFQQQWKESTSENNYQSDAPIDNSLEQPMMSPVSSVK